MFYEIQSSAPFAIDIFSGELTVRQKLDREVLDYYAVTIQAFDQGQPSRKTTKTFAITIIDANDNYPIFSKPQYDVNIKENLAVSAKVEQVFSFLLYNNNNMILCNTLRT